MTVNARLVLLAVLAAALLAAWGCDEGGGGGDADDDDDGSSDGDGDGDSDVDTCEDDPCACYPEGPYRWFQGNVVSPVGFPGRLGPSGADGELHMCDAHAQSATVKSLVFAVGANT